MRNGIAHPDPEPMEEPTRSDTIDSFNRTMDLMVKIFDFLWVDHAEDGKT